jgi:hypothetical protein
MFKVRGALGAGLLAVALSLTACTADSPSTGGESANAQATEIPFPDSDLGQEARWLISQVNTPDDITAEDWEAVLSEDVTSQMSAEELIDLLNKEITPHGPFTLVGFTETGERALADLLSESDEKFTLTLTIDPEDGKIAGMYFRRS